MKKPSRSAIEDAPPLSISSKRGSDPILVCNICGKPSDSLAVWREHDASDLPLEGPARLVFIGKDHPACIRAMERHPRLYAEECGEPGTFPRLCGECSYRAGFDCMHPDLTKNGGAGLLVNLHDPLQGAIICGSRGQIQTVKHAISCAGREVSEAYHEVEKLRG